MKNINIKFSQGLRVLSKIGLFSLVLGSLLVPISQAKAQSAMVSVAITASPGTITAGQSSTINWSSTNATTITITPTVAAAPLTPFGTATVTPSVTTTYTITGSNSTGASGTAQATIFVNPVGGTNPTVAITANPGSVSLNGTSIITWSSTNATSCTASGGTNGWGGVIATSGSFNSGALSNTTTYNISCSNGTGTANASATVSVGGGGGGGGGTGPLLFYPSVFLNADSTNLPFNGSTIVRWFSNDASTCNASNGTNGWSGFRPTSGSFNTGPLTSTTIYNISCSNNFGTAYATVTVFVNGFQSNLPIDVSLTADRTNLAFNESTIIRSFPINATTCTASGGSNGWAGTRSNVADSFNTGPLSFTTTYTISCSNLIGGFDTASVTVNVANRPITVASNTTIIRQAVVRTPPTSLVTITSIVDRNQPIVPTLDNTRPHPGDEINYTVSYQNIGTASITSLNLQIVLPQEVDYMFSNPSNPGIFGSTLMFNLGTLKANGQGVVTVRVRVKDNVPAGTVLNFPATLSYINPAGQPQAVSANVSAQIFGEPASVNGNLLGANIFGAGFLPTNIFGWLILIIFLLILVLLGKHLFARVAAGR